MRGLCAAPGAYSENVLWGRAAQLEQLLRILRNKGQTEPRRSGVSGMQESSHRAGSRTTGICQDLNCAGGGRRSGIRSYTIQRHRLSFGRLDRAKARQGQSSKGESDLNASPMAGTRQVPAFRRQVFERAGRSQIKRVDSPGFSRETEHTGDIRK